MTLARRGQIAAIIATLGEATYLFAGAAFATWFYSAMTVADVYVPWPIVLPSLVWASAYAIAAIGLTRRWWLAFLGAIALHVLTLIRWGALLAFGNPFASEWTAVLPVLLAVVALVGLGLARPLYWHRRSELA
jgi:hypothetical protein